MFDVSCQCLKKTVNQNKSLYITVYIIRIEYLFLMHKKEIHRLYGTIKQQGLTLIPLSVYFKNGRAKMEVGLCKGKKNYDKRDVAAKKEATRTIDRELKERMR